MDSIWDSIQYISHIAIAAWFIRSTKVGNIGTSTYFSVASLTLAMFT